MKEERNIVLNIILTIITCGIYGIVWFIQLTDDAREYSGDETMQSGGLAFLFSLITCGLYTFYWDYKMGKLIEQAESKSGLPAKDNSIIYIILQLFSLGIVNYCLMQSDLNEVTRVKNAQSNIGQAPEAQA